MHIDYFKFFYEVASAKSISKVATSSHISQSALSQQIQRLEDSLGYKLLVRSNKGVELTEEGKIVEKYAKSILKTYDNMIEELESKNNNSNTIKISSNTTIGTYALPCTLFKVKNKYPKNNYELTTSFSLGVEQDIANDLTDVGFIYGEPVDKSLSYIKVGTDRIVLAASSEYFVEQEVDLEKLKKYPLILLQEKLKTRQSIEVNIKEQGFDIKDFKVIMNLDSTESIKSSILKGYGLSFLPYISIKSDIYRKVLKEIEIKDFNMKYDIYLIYKEREYQNKQVKNFISYIKDIGENSFC